MAKHYTQSLYSWCLPRYALFRRTLSTLFGGVFDGDEMWTLQTIVNAVNNALTGAAHFGVEEAVAILQRMTDNEELMLSGEVVYKIS